MSLTEDNNNINKSKKKKKERKIEMPNKEITKLLGDNKKHQDYKKRIREIEEVCIQNS
jgi:hypothetical protein